MGQLEAFIIRFCALLACPSEPFQATLWQDPDQTGYTVRDIAPLSYHFPLLEPLRWPAGGGFEPVLLGSFGRHLAYDLYVRPRLPNLAAENRSALALANYWLAHRLLGLEILPGTHWLEEAAQRDGTQAGLALIEALAENVPPQTAVEAAFRSETIAWISGQPDYFGWLAALQDEVPPALFDQAVDPWAPDGRIYADVLPEIDRVLRRDDWAMAATPTNSDRVIIYFYRRQNSQWVPGEPPAGDDFAVLDALLSRTADQAVRPRREVTGTVGWTPVPATALRRYNLTVTPVAIGQRVQITGTIMATYLTAGRAVWLREIEGQPETVLEFYLSDGNVITGSRIMPAMDALAGGLMTGPTGGSDLLADALLSYQVEHILAGSSGPPDLRSWWEGIWRPPTAIDSSNWRPLSSLWTGGMPQDTQERAILLAQARLVVAYVIETEGPEALAVMIEALEHAHSMAAWVIAIKQQPLGQFEADWRTYVIGSRPGSP